MSKNISQTQNLQIAKTNQKLKNSKTENKSKETIQEITKDETKKYIKKDEKEFTKILSPKLDVIFQALFGEVGSERITKRFLESILKEKINEIDLSKNIVLRREKVDGKLGVLDIVAKINGKENCNIELQLVNEGNIIERLLYYWGKVYTRDLKAGQDYKKLEKTIAVLIADFNLEEIKELEYHTIWKIIEKENRKVILTDKLELHIIELPKIKGKEKKAGELLDWLFFIENPKSERVSERMKKNKELKEAVEKVNKMSRKEYRQRIAELREKAILDRNSALSYATRKGIEQGKKEGEKMAKLEDAKKMLAKKIDIETIVEITGLSKESIMEANIS